MNVLRLAKVAVPPAKVIGLADRPAPTRHDLREPLGVDPRAAVEFDARTER